MISKQTKKIATVKPVIAYIFTATNAIRDSSSGKLSFIDLFDLIKIQKSVGFYYSNMFAGIRINNVKAGHNVTELQLLLPSDSSIFSSSTVSGDVKAGDIEASVSFPIMKFEMSGRYYFKLIHNGIVLDDDKKYYVDVINEE